jgi:hypothetical protein
VFNKLASDLYLQVLIVKDKFLETFSVPKKKSRLGIIIFNKSLRVLLTQRLITLAKKALKQ